VPLVRRAHQLWRELEQISGTKLMTIGGGLMIGPPEGTVVTGTLRSVREHELPHEILSAQHVSERFPAFQLAPELVAIFDPRAGYLFPEACVRAHLDSARASGATIRFDEPVIEWTANANGVDVRTPSATYSAGKLVISAGPWTTQIADEGDLPLEIERQSIFWLDPGNDSAYESERFPIYAYEYKPGHICYGFPRLARGVKASVMHSGEIVDTPQKVQRSVADDEVNALRAALRPVLPRLAAAPVHDRGTCIFTNTPDHDFIIDWHPLHRNVLISSPCSGHGFKFASAIGELQAELLATGTCSFDLSPFRLDRFHPSRQGDRSRK
jgi:sarcosine oxidase